MTSSPIVIKIPPQEIVLKLLGIPAESILNYSAKGGQEPLRVANKHSGIEDDSR